MQDITLVELVAQWINSNPELKKHFSIGARFEVGFYIETRCAGRFTVAWIASNLAAMSAVYGNESYWLDLNPANPDFFKTLEETLRKSHNNFEANRNGCEVKL